VAEIDEKNKSLPFSNMKCNLRGFKSFLLFLKFPTLTQKHPRMSKEEMGLNYVDMQLV